MFERVTGKLLTRLLSKYFTSYNTTQNDTQLGVWSGYIALDSLLLRPEVVNTVLASHGLPFELLQCSFGRIEITVPWAKIGTSGAFGGERSSPLPAGLGASVGGSATAGGEVVIVIDGVHILLATKYEYNDQLMDSARISKRREALNDALEAFLAASLNDPSPADGSGGKNSTDSSGTPSFLSLLKNRLTKGILSELFNNIQVHVRNVHIRLEDTETDPSGNMFAAGITLESLHIQSTSPEEHRQQMQLDQAVKLRTLGVNGSARQQGNVLEPGAVLHQMNQQEPSDCKVVQLNHFAVYWDAIPLDVSRTESTASSILLQFMVDDPRMVSQAMQNGIARRMASSVSSLVLASPPSHDYILRPVGITCRFNLTSATSASNNSDSKLPRIVDVLVSINTVSFEVRDVQFSQIIGFAASVKMHCYRGETYRRYRPKAPVRDNPKEWWLYAFKIVKLELQKHPNRWSRSRFNERCSLRRTYCSLYERFVVAGANENGNRSPGEATATQGATEQKSRINNVENEAQTNGAFTRDVATDALPTSYSNGYSRYPLTPTELEHLHNIEDGICGDFSAEDIVIFRAVANSRLSNEAVAIKAETKRTVNNGDACAERVFRARGKSRVSSFFEGIAQGDVDIKEDYERILAFIESRSKDDGRHGWRGMPPSRPVSVSLAVLLDKCSVSFMHRLHNTCLCRQFFNVSLSDICIEYSLQSQSGLFDFSLDIGSVDGNESRCSGQTYTIINMSHHREPSLGGAASVSESSKIRLVSLSIRKDSKPNSKFDFVVFARVGKIDVVLQSAAEWPLRLKGLFALSDSPSAAGNWEELKLAFINSWKSPVDEIRAKASLALNKKHVDIAVEIDAPTFLISGANEILAVDVGHVTLKTERLAGVASGTIQAHETEKYMHPNNPDMDPLDASNLLKPERPLFTSAFSSKTIPGDVSTKLTPQIESRGWSAGDYFDQFSLGPATDFGMSVDGTRRNNMQLDVSTARSRQRSKGKVGVRHLLQSCFYDTFRIQLRSANIRFLGEGYEIHKQREILQNFTAEALLQRSVLPIDHTLPKFKFFGELEHVGLTLSVLSVTHIGALLETWKSAEKVAFEPFVETVSDVGYFLGLQFGAAGKTGSDDGDETIIDEAEFLDARDEFEAGDTDDLGGLMNLENDYGTVWEHPVKKRRQRSLPSVSDVSSTSADSPMRRFRASKNPYLSAENLAKLAEHEETCFGSPDDDSTASQISSSDSFESAISTGRQEDLAFQLLQDLSKAESEIGRLMEDLATVAKESKEFFLNGNGSLVDRKRIRYRKLELKLELSRSEAELRGLQESYAEVMTCMADAARHESGLESAYLTPDKVNAIREATDRTEFIDGVRQRNARVASENENLSLQLDETVSLRARALLKSRARRSAMKHTINHSSHFVTKFLNKEIMLASLVIKSLDCEIFQQEVELQRDNRRDHVFLLKLRSISCSLRSCSFDSRVAVSLGSMDASISSYKICGGLYQIMRSECRKGYPFEPSRDFLVDESGLWNESPDFLHFVSMITRREDKSTKKQRMTASRTKIQVGMVDIFIQSSAAACLVEIGTKIWVELTKNGSSQNTAASINLSHSKKDVCSEIISKIMGYEAATDSCGPPASFSFVSDGIKLQFDAGSPLFCVSLRGLSARLLRSSIQGRGQVSLTVSDLDLVDLASTCRGSSSTRLFFHKDALTMGSVGPLLCVRLRTHHVPKSLTGGWVVNEKIVTCASGLSSERVWNVYGLLLIKSPSFVFSTVALNTYLHHIQGFIDAARSHRVDAANPRKAQLQNHFFLASSMNYNVLDRACSRWRIDVEVLDYHCSLPCSDTYAKTYCSSSLYLSGKSMHFCAQIGDTSIDSMQFNCCISELQVTMSDGSIALLEPTSFWLDTMCPMPAFLRSRYWDDSGAYSQLQVPKDAQWLQCQCRLRKRRARPQSKSEFKIQSRLSSGSVRVNIATRSMILLQDCFEEMGIGKGVGANRSTEKQTKTHAAFIDSTEDNRENALCFDFYFPCFSVELLRDDNRGRLHPMSLIYSQVTTLNIKLCMHEQNSSFCLDNVHFKIEDISMHDTLCGVEVLRYDRDLTDAVNCGEEREGKKSCAASLYISVYPDSDGIRTLLAAAKFGSCRFFLLPSLMSNMSWIAHPKQNANERRTMSTDRPPGRVVGSGVTKTLPFNVDRVVASIASNGFELMISARDFTSPKPPSSREPISVVALRWKYSLNACLSSCSDRSPHLTSTTALTKSLGLNFQKDVVHDDMTNDSAVEALRKWLLHLNAAARRNSNSTAEVYQILTSKVEICLDDFQIVRTSIKEIAATRESALKGRRDTSGKSFKVKCYATRPHISGEQRILSPFSFKIVHGMALASFSPALADDDQHPESSNMPFILLPQSLHVDVGHIDALLYVEQSSEGVHEAIRNTFRHAVARSAEIPHHQSAVSSRSMGRKQQHFASEAMRTAGTEVMPATKSDLFHFGSSPPDHQRTPKNGAQPKKSFISELVCRSSFTFSVRSSGVQITVVPGTMTNLTEAPIMKATVKHVEVGGSSCPVKVDLSGNIIGSRTDDASQSILNRANAEGVSGGHDSKAASYSTYQLAIWCRFELSAHYNNRRLVAWEPLLEPWPITCRAGVNLTQMLNLPLSTFVDKVLVALPPENFSPSFRNLVYNRKNRASDFLRGISRRFLSQTTAMDPEKGVIAAISPSVFCSATDLSHLILYALTPQCMGLALFHRYQETGAQSEPDERIASVAEVTDLRLPSYLQNEWLTLHGFPPLHPNIAKTSNSIGYHVAVSDSKPLNLNLTGALLDNIITFMPQGKDDQNSQDPAPHLIRNDCGLRIKYTEALDIERQLRGETSSSAILANASCEALALKRSLSQTCDPYRAYISLELFEARYPGDDEGAVLQNETTPDEKFEWYRVLGLIDVDTVGVHEHFLYRQRFRESRSGLLDDLADTTAVDDLNSQICGLVVVRVSLIGNTKLVAIESPLLLKNITHVPLYCEAIDHDGIPVWVDTLPAFKSVEHPLPVPCNLFSRGNLSFTITALPLSYVPSDLSSVHSVSIPLPPPFSEKSAKKGVIASSEVTLNVCSLSPTPKVESINLNVCSLRIGDFSARNSADRFRDARGCIPEQRMLLFRPTFAFKNYLPHPLLLQVRVVSSPAQMARNTQWTEVGVVKSGEVITWAGAFSFDQAEVRAKLLQDSTDEEPLRHFFHWSTPVLLLSEDQTLGLQASAQSLKLVLTDNCGIPLSLSVAFEEERASCSSAVESAKLFCDTLAPALRVVAIYVPFWVVDTTGLNLEIMADSLVAGQHDAEEHGGETLDFMHDSMIDHASTPPSPAHDATDVLNEMHDDLSTLVKRRNFVVRMIGDERSSKLTIRIRRRIRSSDGRHQIATSSWSDPISLRPGVSTIQPLDIFSVDACHVALSSRVFHAPEGMGGGFESKIVHIANRYVLVNQTHREIEVIACKGSAEDGKVVSVTASIALRVNGREPFHFDDKGVLRFRPKEYGWDFSCGLDVRNRLQETIRLHNRLTGNIIIFDVEFHRDSTAPGSTVVLREAARPPFRLENHSLHPISYFQATYYHVEQEDAARWFGERLESIILPYHSANYAWEYPHMNRRILMIEAGSIGGSASQTVHMPSISLLGKLELEKLVPGTSMKSDDGIFEIEIVADGPTRVVRVLDASLPKPCTANEATLNATEFRTSGNWIEVNLTCGLGLSVVDFTPRELIYVQVSDIQFERRTGDESEEVKVSVGSVTLNNQLWVTPYPVLLQVGQTSLALPPQGNHLVHFKRKRKKAAATTLSFSREFGHHGGLTLFRSVELSTEPMNIMVDGVLVDHIISMIKDIVGARTDSEKRQLWEMLGIEVSDTHKSGEELKSETAMYAISEENLMITSMMASRHDIKSIDANIKSAGKRGGKWGGMMRSEDFSMEQHKYYIEKLSISTFSLNLSWSGPLPAFFTLPDFLRPALTFEGLPVSFRAYSRSHAYGTTKELLLQVKSHYLNVRRILDFVLGLSFKPLFLTRATIHTIRQSTSSSLERFSRLCLTYASSMQAWYEFQVRRKLRDEWRSKEALTGQETAGNGDQVLPFVGLLYPVKILFGFLRTFSRFSSILSAGISYGGVAHGSFSSVADSLRTRPPRLFAKQDGKDLLVEYVERGENAGKALLSRLRGGMYLSEGYFHHTECYHRGNGANSSFGHEWDTVVMVTSRRILHLKWGDKGFNTCNVSWNMLFKFIACVEVITEVAEGLDEVRVWHVSESVDHLPFMQAEWTAAREEATNAQNPQENVGLNALQCKTIHCRDSEGWNLVRQILAHEPRLCYEKIAKA